MPIGPGQIVRGQGMPGWAQAAQVGGVGMVAPYASVRDLAGARKRITTLLYPREASYGTLSDIQQRRVNATPEVLDVLSRMEGATPKQAAPAPEAAPATTPRVSPEQWQRVKELAGVGR